jgi:hypothetical protein
MHESESPAHQVKLMPLVLLSSGWGAALSYAAFELSLEYTGVIHWRMADGTLAEVWAEVLLAAIAYLAALVFPLWAAQRLSPWPRLCVRVCVLAFALPGAAMGTLLMLLHPLFPKGIA